MCLKDGMVFYHGSYMAIESPDLRKCRNRKDFGRGFYLTTDRVQAKRFTKTAIIKAKKEGIVSKDYQMGYFSSYILLSEPGYDKNFLFCSDSPNILLYCFTLNAIIIRPMKVKKKDLVKILFRLRKDSCYRFI